MEENLQPKSENNFIFSKTVRAGKRIYYFDVKKTQTTDSLYITITESKKNILILQPQKMVSIAQLVRVADCGSVGRGFESHYSPKFIEN